MDIAKCRVELYSTGIMPNMNMHIFYKMLPLIEEAFHRLEKKIEALTLVSIGKFKFFRYKNKWLCFLYR